jgi:hypothetical protein
MMFSTLDQKRNEITTRRERFVRWFAGSILAVIVLGGIYLITLTA